MTDRAATRAPANAGDLRARAPKLTPAGDFAAVRRTARDPWSGAQTPDRGTAP